MLGETFEDMEENNVGNNGRTVGQWDNGGTMSKQMEEPMGGTIEEQWRTIRNSGWTTGGTMPGQWWNNGRMMSKV